VGSSLKDLRAFPDEVQDAMGFFGGVGVLEIVEDHDGDTYRAVFTVKFAARSMCCTPSRRNRRGASPPRSTSSS
jgi:phage-related protein